MAGAILSSYKTGSLQHLSSSGKFSKDKIKDEFLAFGMSTPTLFFPLYLNIWAHSKIKKKCLTEDMYEFYVWLVLKRIIFIISYSCCWFTLMEARVIAIIKRSTNRLTPAKCAFLHLCCHVSSKQAVLQTDRWAELTSDWQLYQRNMIQKCLISFRGSNLSSLFHATL